jgi:plasmid stabilization system protein ParE
VPDTVVSNAADGDLGEIYEYSFRTFGEAKADAYFLSLRHCLQALADDPRLGRSAAAIVQWTRINHGSSWRHRRPTGRFPGGGHASSWLTS